MSKKLFQFALMAALTCGISLSVTSCKDDDDDDGRSAEEKAADPYEKETDAGHALFNLLSQLSVMPDNELPDNWKDATFEPTAGEVTDASQPFVRSITVNSLDEAVTRYNSLTGKTISSTIQSDTWEMDELGQMTFTAQNQTNCFATIDVNVKQLPKLTQLRFVPVSAIGDNGTFDGAPYYRFGDVVKDPKENTYWICVRPAYSPNKKEDTHWMSFQLGTKNTTDPKKSGCLPQTVPTKLGKELEKMQYLAQLLTIFARPNDQNNLDTSLKSFQAEFGNQPFSGSGNIGIGGLLQDAMPNAEIIRAAELWLKNDIWNLVKPSSEIDAATFRQAFTKGVKFLYEGYSTSVMNKNLTLYRVSYEDVNNFFRSKPFYDNVTLDMTKVKFDVNNKFSKNGTCGDTSYEVVGNCFVVRYKTGFQLSTNYISNPDATKAIPGVEEVYRFNDPKYSKISEEDVKLGYIIGKDGKFYINANAAQNAGTEAAAMVVYLGGDKRVEEGQRWNGLAIAVKDLKVDDRDFAPFAAQNENDEYISSMVYDRKMYANVLDGFAKTTSLAGIGDSYPAAKAVSKMDKINSSDIPMSGWFLPSTGQWILALNGMGYTWDGATFGNAGHWLWSQAGVTNGELTSNAHDGRYWTANEAPYGMAMSLTLDLTYAFVPQDLHADKVRVRPMLAFGSKGTQDPEDVPLPVAPEVGAVMCANGLCFKNFEVDKALSEPRAYVAYVGTDGSVEKDKNWRGLAIGLDDVPYLGKEDCAWASEEAKDGVCSSWAKNLGDLSTILDGISQSEKLWGGCGEKNHTHNVALCVKDYNDNHKVENASKWFVPSVGQWMLALKGVGVEFQNDKFTPEGQAGTDKLNNLFQFIGTKLLTKAQEDEEKYDNKLCGYWTSTEYAENENDATRPKVYRINFQENESGISIDTCPKTKLNFVRPFIAF
ncbi:MAG: hypothetical protein IKG77_06660 [Prevotella sp.]|nr:hypothetical protein [Prevotella sp.]